MGGGIPTEPIRADPGDEEVGEEEDLMKTSSLIAILLLLLSTLLTPLSAVAQQVTGELGSPSATTTIQGNQHRVIR
jgi:hypothetical protein